MTAAYSAARAQLRKALGLDARERSAHGRPGPAPSHCLPRLVTRGESKEPSCFACETSSQDETWDESERIETRPGRDGRPILKAYPTPHEQTPSGIAHVDGFCFTVTPPNPASTKASLAWIFPALAEIFGCPVLTDTKTGWNGYEQKYDLGTPGAFLAIGGKAQRGTIHVEFMGMACAKVPDWNKVQAWGESVDAKITRIDLAHDDFEGLVVNIDNAVQWHKEGGFKNGGRPPRSQCLGDWLDPGSPKGRTLQIGSRENGKAARVYEKGKQLGDPHSPWCRAEVEWHDTNRVLSWDMVTRPGQYLAGAYPCLKFLSAQQDKVKTFQKAAKISLERATENLRHMGGKVINVLMLAHGKPESVIKAVRRDGIPSRLEGYDGLVRWNTLQSSSEGTP